MPESYLPDGHDTSVTVPELSDYANVNVAFKEFADSLVLSGASVPAGTVTMFVGSTAPNGWHLCDGGEVAVATNPVLGGLLADNRYGAATPGMVKLPNMTSLFPMGTAAGAKPGASGGSTEVTLTSANMPQHSHTHNLTAGNGGEAHNHSVTINGTTMSGDAAHSHSGSTGTDGAHSHGSFYSSISATGTSGSLAAASAVGADQRKSLISQEASGAAHSHSVTTGTDKASHTHGVNITASTGNATAGHTHSLSGTIADAGSASPLPLSVRPPFVAFNFIIKLG